MNFRGSHDQDQIENQCCCALNYAKGGQVSRVRSTPTLTATTKTDTKHTRIVAMLRSPGGATIASIMTATEWQQHSVRGFLAGVVRKSLASILFPK